MVIFWSKFMETITQKEICYKEAKLAKCSESIGQLEIESSHPLYGETSLQSIFNLLFHLYPIIFFINPCDT
jgi:hypothetical protein